MITLGELQAILNSLPRAGFSIDYTKRVDREIIAVYDPITGGYVCKTKFNGSGYGEIGIRDYSAILDTLDDPSVTFVCKSYDHQGVIFVKDDNELTRHIYIVKLLVRDLLRNIYMSILGVLYRIGALDTTPGMRSSWTDIRIIKKVVKVFRR